MTVTSRAATWAKDALTGLYKLEDVRRLLCLPAGDSLAVQSRPPSNCADVKIFCAAELEMRLKCLCSGICSVFGAAEALRLC